MTATVKRICILLVLLLGAVVVAFSSLALGGVEPGDSNAYISSEPADLPEIPVAFFSSAP